MRIVPFLIALLLAAPALAPTSAMAQDRPTAFTGARIIPITAPEIPTGVLLIQNGKILAVGDITSTPIPDNADRIDLSGKTLMPGLVDTHSHLGSGWGGDASGPIQPETRILDSINVRDAGLQKAQAGGLTTLNVMPGSGHLISGQTIYIKLKDADTIDDLAIKNPDGSLAGGLKMANGTNSQRDPPFPGTRGKSAALVREKFIKAREYRDKIARAGGNPEKMPDRDLSLEPLVEAMDGKRIVHHHTHRHDDIITVLRLSREFGFRVVLHHVSEGYKVADEIAAAGVPCSVILVDSPGGKIEAMNMTFSCAAALDQAGVLVAFHTDDGITDSRLFFRSAALAVRAGLPRAKALEALTIAGAKMLDLHDRIGSLEPGKDADFLILSGDPLSVYTKVEKTYVEGVPVFDRSDPKDRLYAVGGYGASKDHLMYLCCEDDDGH